MKSAFPIFIACALIISLVANLYFVEERKHYAVQQLADAAQYQQVNNRSIEHDQKDDLNLFFVRSVYASYGKLLTPTADSLVKAMFRGDYEDGNYYMRKMNEDRIMMFKPIKEIK